MSKQSRPNLDSHHLPQDAGAGTAAWHHALWRSAYCRSIHLSSQECGGQPLRLNLRCAGPDSCVRNPMAHGVSASMGGGRQPGGPAGLPRKAQNLLGRGFASLFWLYPHPSSHFYHILRLLRFFLDGICSTFGAVPVCHRRVLRFRAVGRKRHHRQLARDCVSTAVRLLCGEARADRILHFIPLRHG